MEISKELQVKIESYQKEGAELSRIVITNNEQYEQSIAFGKQVQAKIKELETEKKKITDPLEQSKKAAIELFRKPIDFLTTVKNDINTKALAYYNEQERIRRAAEQKLQEEAAEKQRKLDEQIMLKEADGKSTDKLEQKKAEIVVPKLQTAVPKINGAFVKKTWRARVIDFKSLPDDYKLPNEPMLNGLAKSSEGKMVIPGVEFYEDAGFVNRR